MLDAINLNLHTNFIEKSIMENPLKNNSVCNSAENNSSTENKFETFQRQQGIMGKAFYNIAQNKQSNAKAIKTVNFCGSANDNSSEDNEVYVDSDTLNECIKNKLEERLGYEIMPAQLSSILSGKDSYTISPIELQKIINDSYRECFDMGNSIEIDKRKILLTPNQKNIYSSKINSPSYKYDYEHDIYAKNIQDSYYGQVIMSDAMFVEAMAVNMGIDITNKSSQEIFSILQEKYISDGQDMLPGIVLANKDEVLEAFFMRDSMSESIEKVGNIGGDKAIHELNKALCSYLDKDDTFRKNWVSYCDSSNKFKKFSALADTHKEILYNQMQGTKAQKEKFINSKIENLNHVIFRAIQRDCLFDINSFKWKNWEDDTVNIEDISFPVLLAEKISSNNNSEEFMGKKLTREGQNKYQTIEYDLPVGYDWGTQAEYIPNAAA